MSWKAQTKAAVGAGDGRAEGVPVGIGDPTGFGSDIGCVKGDGAGTAQGGPQGPFDDDDAFWSYGRASGLGRRDGASHFAEGDSNGGGVGCRFLCEGWSDV